MNQEQTEPLPPRALRDALGRYATGVTVVTAVTVTGPVGITANSFSSVSLDPPLVLWCPARRSARFAAFFEADRYSIHVLSAAQLDLCQHFARTGGDFSAVAHMIDATGFLHLPGCLARFDCLAHERFDGGDHAILVGRVMAAEIWPGDPLLFWGGRYGDFLQHGD